MNESLKPLGDRVVIRLIEADEKSPGGIVLPDNAKEKPSRGRVIAVGPGKFRQTPVDPVTESPYEPMGVQFGDEVVFARYAGHDVKIDGETLIVLRESDIFAVVEKKPAVAAA